MRRLLFCLNTFLSFNPQCFFYPWDPCSLVPLSAVAGYFFSTGRAEAKQTNNPLLQYFICNTVHLKCGKEILHLYLILNRDRWYPWNQYWGALSSVMYWQGFKLFRRFTKLNPYQISICAAPDHLHNRPTGRYTWRKEITVICLTDGAEWVLTQWDNPTCQNTVAEDICIHVETEIESYFWSQITAITECPWSDQKGSITLTHLTLHLCHTLWWKYPSLAK